MADRDYPEHRNGDEADEDLDELLEDELVDDEELDHETSRSRSIGVFIVGLAAGAVIGASAALFLAPARGNVTRQRVRRRIRDLGGDARDRIDEWRDGAGREVRRRRRRRRIRSRRG